jgi:hypothetical protein
VIEADFAAHVGRVAARRANILWNSVNTSPVDGLREGTHSVGRDLFLAPSRRRFGMLWACRLANKLSSKWRLGSQLNIGAEATAFSADP